MKRPRIEDFDPTAASKLHSSLDHMPAIERPDQASASESPHTAIAVSVAALPSVRTPRPSVRRVIVRYPFELYQDQVDELRDLALQEKLQGLKGSMSQMVREALDRYIAERKGSGR